jgi:hypothetical protein
MWSLLARDAYWRGGMGEVYPVRDSKLVQYVRQGNFANSWFVETGDLESLLTSTGTPQPQVRLALQIDGKRATRASAALTVREWYVRIPSTCTIMPSSTTRVGLPDADHLNKSKVPLDPAGMCDSKKCLRVV